MKTMKIKKMRSYNLRNLVTLQLRPKSWGWSKFKDFFNSKKLTN